MALIGLTENPSVQRRLMALLFAACLLFAHAVTPIRAERGLGIPYLTYPDSFGYYSYMPAILLGEGLDFQRLYERVILPEKWPGPPPPRFNNSWSVGCAILWTPFFLAAHAVTLAANALGADLPADGYSWVYQAFAATATILYFFLGLFRFHRLLGDRFGWRVSGYVTGLTFGATFLFNYVIYANLMSHALTFFASVGYLDALMRIGRPETEPRKSDFARAAVWLGLMGLIRPQNAILGLPLLWLAAREAGRPPNPDSPGAPSAGLGRLTWFFPLAITPALIAFQVVLWRIERGQWMLQPQGEGFMRWTSPELWRVLISNRHGLFFWHPVLLLGCWGVAMSIRRGGTGFSPGVWIGLILAFLAMTYINAVVRDWWAGSSFGMRRYDGFVAPMMFGIAQWLGARGAQAPIPRALWAAGAGLILLNMALWLCWMLNLAPRLLPH